MVSTLIDGIMNVDIWGHFTIVCPDVPGLSEYVSASVNKPESFEMQ